MSRRQADPLPKNVRVDNDLWERFGRATAKHDIDRSTALRQFIRWYVHDPDAMEPQRPSTPTPSGGDE